MQRDHSTIGHRMASNVCKEEISEDDPVPTSRSAKSDRLPKIGNRESGTLPAFPLFFIDFYSVIIYACFVSENVIPP